LKKTIFLSILILIVVTESYSQQNNRILVSGTVKNMNLEPIPYTHIIVNKQKGIASDKNGKFLFFGNVSDTLIFSAIGYKKSKYILPSNVEDKEYFFTKILLADTVHLKETLILPWHTYKEFKDAVVKTKIPEDEYDRAYKNCDFILKQYIISINDPDLPAPPASCQNYVQQRRNFESYSAGQVTPINILNIAAWAELIKSINRGDFKKKKTEE
jgi:hypothetical protein